MPYNIHPTQDWCSASRFLEEESSSILKQVVTNIMLAVGVGGSNSVVLEINDLLNMLKHLSEALPFLSGGKKNPLPHFFK